MPRTANIDPAIPFEHPSDVIIDVPGAFVGKRSERILIRWKKPKYSGSRNFCGLRIAEENGPNTDSAEEIANEKDDQLQESKSRQIAKDLVSLWRAPMEPLPDETPQEDRFTRLEKQLDALCESQPDTQEDKEHAERIRAIPLCRLKSLTISGNGVTVSSDAVAALVERGIGLSFLSTSGKPIAQVSAPGLNGTVQTRRSQLAAFDSSLGVDLAVEFIRGKLRNQKHQLQYSGKYLKAKYPDRFEKLERKITSILQIRKQVALIRGDSVDPLRDRLMGYEGTAARLYWEGVAILLEGRAEFPGRITRGATDPINSALNYGYGILYSKVASAIVNAGLEMYAGFLHVDRPGKPALVLDLVEEFRAPIVDRAVLSIVNQGIVLEGDSDGITSASRRVVAERVLARLGTSVPYEGKQWPLSAVIQMQARHLAVAVRGERIYRAYASRW